MTERERRREETAVRKSWAGERLMDAGEPKRSSWREAQENSWDYPLRC